MNIDTEKIYKNKQKRLKQGVHDVLNFIFSSLEKANFKLKTLLTVFFFLIILR